MTILLVGEFSESFSALRDRAASFSGRIVHATTPRRAVARLMNESVRPTILVIDVKLPRDDVRWLLGRWNGIPEVSSKPVLFARSTKDLLKRAKDHELHLSIL
jgi:hypothetical protein